MTHLVPSRANEILLDGTLYNVIEYAVWPVSTMLLHSLGPQIPLTSMIYIPPQNRVDVRVTALKAELAWTYTSMTKS